MKLKLYPGISFIISVVTQALLLKNHIFNLSLYLPNHQLARFLFFSKIVIRHNKNYKTLPDRQSKAYHLYLHDKVHIYLACAKKMCSPLNIPSRDTLYDTNRSSVKKISILQFFF